MSTETHEKGLRLLTHSEIIEIATALTVEWVKHNPNFRGSHASAYFIEVCRSLTPHAADPRVAREAVIEDGV